MKVRFVFQMAKHQARALIQNLLEEQLRVGGQILSIQKQLNELEALYLERTCHDGNPYIGWNHSLLPTSTVSQHSRITIDAKQKMFSLSSVSSPASGQLNCAIDRQLVPHGEHRFQHIKKNKNKNSSNNMHKHRPIRKKKRR